MSLKDWLVLYKPRALSYDEDWLDAFSRAGAVLTKMPAEFRSVNIIMHSVTAQWGDPPQWILDQAGKGKTLVLVANEFKDCQRKDDFAKSIGATLGTQLDIEDARGRYKAPLIQVPHALNPDVYFPRVPYAERKVHLGVMGGRYFPRVRDGMRESICNPAIWGGLRTDITLGNLLDRGAWAKLLSTWRAMPTTEAGDVGGKIMSPRHYDAIGSLTCLVSYPGKYNGILDSSHYIELDRNHRNLAEVKERIRDEVHCEQLVSRAREYLLDSHTYAHRIKLIEGWASATG